MNINYVPSGETIKKFHHDDSFVRMIRGCVGSGKTTACLYEILIRTLKQTPCVDRVRRSRWIVIRSTYPELKSTTIKSWLDLMGNICTMKYDVPITSTIKIDNIGDGTGLDLEVVFIALDSDLSIEKLKSFETTGIFFNEISGISEAVFQMGTSRVGRYPSKTMMGDKKLNWTGIIADTNPPDDDSWYYRLAEQDKPEGYSFYKQEGGLRKDRDPKSPTFGKYVPNPLAENIHNHNLGYEYYLNQLAGKSEDWIKVYLCGDYGTTMAGKPVYPEWAEKMHLSKEKLMPISGMPVICSFDFGLTPACAFIQMSPNGQLLVLDELVSTDMGIRQFYSEVVRPYILQRYSQNRVEAVGDPAGNQRAQTDEKTCIQELLNLGLVCEPAPTNEFIARRESVAFFLQRVANGKAGFLLDPDCHMLRKGFNNGYRYERLRVSGNTAKFKDRPVKDKFSHIHDALQYGCLHMRHEMNPVRARSVRNGTNGGWF